MISTDERRDAELLAEAIIATHNGTAEARAVTGHQTMRDVLSHKLFDVVDTVATRRWADAEIGGLLLRLRAISNEVEYLSARNDLPVLHDAFGRAS